MNATLAPPAAGIASKRRLLTIADVAALPRCLPTGEVKYELDEGRLVVMSPPGGFHVRGQFRIMAHLYNQGESRQHGKGFGDVGVILRRNPDRLVGPDASFVCSASLPVRMSSEGYLETIPELVVEVRSKNDTQPEIDEKAAEYLSAGVIVVWVPDPARRCVMEYRAGREVRQWGPTEHLTIPDLIPDFDVLVTALFD